MIDPTYLANLRSSYSSEYLLLLAQLEQLNPPFWRETQRLLAQDLGIHRSNLNRGMQFLRRRDLIRYATRPGASGIWVWWVKSSEADRPNPADQPCWTLARLDNSARLRVPVDDCDQWAADQGVTREAMRRFLAGRQRTLAGRYRLVAGPIDFDCHAVRRRMGRGCDVRHGSRSSEEARLMSLPNDIAHCPGWGDGPDDWRLRELARRQGVGA